jgi:hypothetical protein
VVAAVVFGLIVAGAAVGEDDHFPFGPFRMYATATKPTGAVSFPMLEGVTTDGRVVRFRTGQFGLRRAELEGQLRLAPDRQDLLADLAVAYRRFQPDAPPLQELRLVRVSKHIDGRELTGRSERVMATYRLHKP